MRALAQTVHGLAEVDVEEDVVLALDADAQLPPREQPTVSLPLLVAADAVGSRVVAVVDRRPPLAISDDAGTTWREAGGGLPPGRAVAIEQDDPDLVLYGARNRLYVSRDGGRFWAALAPELPEISAVVWADG
jgi:photosystem II stability/assembly factor-like uncharacterized protein